MSEFDKLVRQHLYSVLRDLGFDKIGNRNSYKWEDQVVYRLQIKAVGSYFADVTGWPPSSFSCSISPYYSFLYDSCDKDLNGKIIPPKRWPSEGGLLLSRSIDQSPYTSNLQNNAERERVDLWWLEKDESNVNEVVEDLIRQVKEHIPQYLYSSLASSYTSNRDFFPPNEEALQLYIEKASEEGAIYWLKKLIKFSGYLKHRNDEIAYKNLLSKIE